MKPEVEAKVGEALMKLWSPMANSIGIKYIVPNDIDDIKRLNDDTLHFDNEHWDRLVEVFEKEMGSIAEVWSTSQELRISLDGVRQFSISVSRESYEEDDEVDGSDLDGMTRVEAIEYLTELAEIPSFEYAVIEICMGNHYIHRLIGANDRDDNFYAFISQMIEGILQTPEVYNEAVKAASIELQKKAEKQREIDNRIKA